MKTADLRALILLGVLMFSPALSLAGSPARPPQLTTVFEQPRSDTEDVIYFRNKDILRGRVLNKDIEIATQYGMLTIPMALCAGISSEGARTNTEAIVTVNFNRITGIITDRVIHFRIGSSGTEIPIRKEKIRFIMLQRTANENDFLKGHEKADVFIMANGDVLTGEAVERKVEIRTDYGKIPVAFEEMKTVVMQGGDNVTAVIGKTNGDTMRGTLETEEITLALEIGLKVEAVYKDKFAKVFIDQARTQAPVQFGIQQPILGESDGVLPIAADGESLINSIGLRMIYIRPGEFWMGSPGNEPGHEEDESPQHLVKLMRGFYLGATEITQKQWVTVMGSRPWNGKECVEEGDECAATYVSWDDAVAFCKKLSQTEGRNYRLPTEAEWEYACRAGTKTAYSFGDNASQLGEYAWFDGSVGGQKYAHGVGRKKANPWGLFDMHGNVWEWCADWYGKASYPTNPIADPTGSSSGTSRVVRGGSWRNFAALCRAADRGGYTPDARYYSLGFRVALDLN